MRALLLISLIAYNYQNLLSQPLPGGPSKSIAPIQSSYVELGGNGVIYSLNYDAVFNDGWGIRIGGGYLPERVDRSQRTESRYYGTDLLVVLLMGEYLVGKGSHKLETGAGIILGESNLEDKSINAPDPPGLTFSLGYRYLSGNKGDLTYKIAFTPIIAEAEIFPTIGISLGVIIGD